MTTHPHLEDLRAFCEVADKGSITAAARALNESKGAVSRRVSRLEMSLGVALIHRVGGRAKPTPDGLQYRQRAGAALDLLTAAAEALRDQEGAPRGHLRVTVLPGFVAGLVEGPIGRFLAAYPGITVEMIVTERVLTFREDRIDFALRPVVGQMADSGHMALALAPIQLCLAASPQYLEAHGTPTHPRELGAHRLLVPPVRGRVFPLRLQPLGRPEAAETFELTGHLVAHDTRFLQAAAVAGGGITLMIPPSTGADGHPPVAPTPGLVRLLEDWEVVAPARLYMIHPAGLLSAKARAFRDHMKAEFAPSSSSSWSLSSSPSSSPSTLPSPSS